MPVFGICLGHQILGLALGGQTYKLKFGHHGGNQPVQDLTTGKVEITAQNHGFAVDVDSLRGRAELTFDVDAVLDALADIRVKHGLGGAAPAPEVAEAMRAHAAKRVLITVTPEHVASWDHRKLAGAY